MIAFDIETTGLDPNVDVVRAISWAKSYEAGVFWAEERELLYQFDDFLAEQRSPRIVTWNGHEFDLPFLAARIDLNRLVCGLMTFPTGEVGKYGNPLYTGTWHSRLVEDIAPEYKQYAEQNGVKWSLKPVAESLELHPVQVPKEVLLGEDLYPVLPYAVSDAIVTLRLALKLREGI